MMRASLTWRHSATLAFVIIAICFATQALAIWVPQLFFDENSAELSSEAQNHLKEVVAAVHERSSMPVVKLIIYGHADKSEADPMGLSLRRARAVRDELYRIGMRRSVAVEIRIIGPGDPMTLAPEERAMNRRVAIEMARRTNEYGG